MSLSFHSKSFWYYTLLAQMEESFRIQVSMLGSDERETEQVKVIIHFVNLFFLLSFKCVLCI
jgi:hypothetical protein